MWNPQIRCYTTSRHSSIEDNRAAYVQNARTAGQTRRIVVGYWVDSVFCIGKNPVAPFCSDAPTFSERRMCREYQARRTIL
jgi:hypothetical protein